MLQFQFVEGNVETSSLRLAQGQTKAVKQSQQHGPTALFVPFGGHKPVI